MQIRELHLDSGDLKGTATFYGDLLGLPVLKQTGKTLELQVGETLLVFNASKHKDPRYHFACNIPSNQVRQARDWVKERCPIIPLPGGEEIADFRNWNAEAFYFSDHNGSVLECIGRRDLPNKSAVAFGPSAFLCISEIGIVTSNFKEECERFRKRFSLGYFDKQPPSPSFAAIGDDHGLFIVVPEGRHWYPTDVPSCFCNTKVSFLHDGQEYEYRCKVSGTGILQSFYTMMGPGSMHDEHSLKNDRNIG